MFKGLTARRLYKSFDVKGFNNVFFQLTITTSGLLTSYVVEFLSVANSSYCYEPVSNNLTYLC
jgi:hypothetical protein